MLCSDNLCGVNQFLFMKFCVAPAAVPFKYLVLRSEDRRDEIHLIDNEYLALNANWCGAAVQ